MEALVVPKKYKPFTDHSSDGMFARIYLRAIGTVAREKTNLSTDFRLFLLGLQRVSNRGHAVFKPGEIVSLMPQKTGEMYEERYINSLIKTLKNAGLLAPASNIRCLIYPVELILLKTDKKNAPKCEEHGTHSSWSVNNNDWVPDSLPVRKDKEVIVPLIESVEDISDELDEIYSRIEGTNGSY
jgi:hypothetical protein